MAASIFVDSEPSFVASCLSFPIYWPYHSRAERYAKALANSIVHTKGFDGGGQNSYFYDSSEGLITSIILLVAQYCKPEERHIVSVFKILLEFAQTVKSANDETDSQRKVKQTKLNEILSLLPEDDKIRWFAGSVPGSEGMQYLAAHNCRGHGEEKDGHADDRTNDSCDSFPNAVSLPRRDSGTV